MSDRDDKIAFLANSLAKAKQVMKKVEANHTPKNYDAPPTRQRQIAESAPTANYDDDQEYTDTTAYLSEDQVQHLGGIQPQSEDLYSEGYEPQVPMPQAQAAPKFIPFKNLNKTKMPSAIVESFLSQPMIDPTKPLGMESLIDQVAKKVKPQAQAQQPVREAAQRQPQPKQAPAPAAPQTSGMDIQLLEFVIQKTVEATLKEISKKTNLDENIQIKIGDKMFGGKITTLKETTVKK